MRVVVIGGTGFIGRYLVWELLRGGHEVGILHRPESTASIPQGAHSIRGDRRRLSTAQQALHGFAADVVIDLILSSGRQAAELIGLFRGHAGRVVAISSMDVYRATGVLHGSEEGPLEPLPLREDSRLRTTSQTYPPSQIEMLQQLFGWLDDEYDKILVEREVCGSHELPATVLRLPMVYGPGDHLHRFFPTLKRMDDRRAAIVLPERLAAWMSPRGYVENVATAIALASTTERAANRTYNVGEGECFSELQWARLIAAEVGWTGSFVLVPEENAPSHLRISGNLRQHWVVDTTRIRVELGYGEFVTRDEAIRRTIDWQRRNPPPIDAARFDYRAEDEALGALTAHSS